uniref:Uncharacterized protein n=1 Tax=Arcella intermedia TaxID=1963864 RepID=A0A6B2LRX8_9EUKA
MSSKPLPPPNPQLPPLLHLPSPLKVHPRPSNPLFSIPKGPTSPPRTPPPPPNPQRISLPPDPLRIPPTPPDPQRIPLPPPRPLRISPPTSNLKQNSSLKTTTNKKKPQNQKTRISQFSWGLQIIE